MGPGPLILMRYSEIAWLVLLRRRRGVASHATSLGSNIMSRSSTSVGGFTLYSMLVSVLIALPMAVQAAGLLLNDLKAQNAIQLTAEELKQLMPNAKVVSYYVEGGTSTRRWTNESDGKFVASSDLGSGTGPMQRRGGSTAQGTWHVGDNGTYCVTIDWRTRSENWCRYIFKVGGKYYGVRNVTDGAVVAHEFEFSK